MSGLRQETQWLESMTQGLLSTALRKARSPPLRKMVAGPDILQSMQKDPGFTSESQFWAVWNVSPGPKLSTKCICPTVHAGLCKCWLWWCWWRECYRMNCILWTHEALYLRMAPLQRKGRYSEVTGMDSSLIWLVSLKEEEIRAQLLSREASTHREKPREDTGRETVIHKPNRKISGEINPVNIFSLDLKFPELWEHKFLLVGPPSLWHFVIDVLHKWI